MTCNVRWGRRMAHSDEVLRRLTIGDRAYCRSLVAGGGDAGG
jgi:hypothetical protein